MYFPGSCATPLSNITNTVDNTNRSKEARAKRKSIMSDAKVANKSGTLDSIRTLTFEDVDSPMVQGK